MSEAEKKQTDQKKQSASKQGKQYVENTDKAKVSRKKAAKDDREDEEEANSGGQDKDSQPEEGDGNEGEDEDEHDSPNDDQENEEPKPKTGQKRGRGKADDSPSKKQKSKSGQSTKDDDNNEGTEEHEEDSKSNPKPKENSKSKIKDNKSPEGTATIGSKHMDATEPAQKGSADRLPKKDQKVQWRAMPGYVSGKLVEVLKSDQTIDGKSHKASAKDPKLVLESDSSGKICVHKPETCFYD